MNAPLADDISRSAAESAGGKAHYLMVGGFLGAGKTTAILRLASLLRDRMQRVGLISNDQSFGLVDSQLFAAQGFPVAEITGGCFCCKFNSLVEASAKLAAQSPPDVFIAEPVGSCTDLKATVDFPLRRLYGENYRVAPLSVLVDPRRAARMLGLETGPSFSRKVLYIYDKQLEEADLIVINKLDQLTPQRHGELAAALAAKYPRARVIGISARTGDGVQAWLDAILSGPAAESGGMDVDYDVYADGEALLGWLNAAVTIAPGEPFDGNRWTLELAHSLRQRLAAGGAEVAHLKLTLTPDEGRDLAVVNLVRSDAEPEQAYQLDEALRGGELLINLRAEADPQALRGLVNEVIASAAAKDKLSLRFEHLEAFRPGRPTPTHRLH